MRLLECKGGDIRLAKFQQDELPDYAILSHTWGPDHEEVTFQDIENKTAQDKPGYEKLKFCSRQAETDNLQYFWIDTCCINKDSSAELQESLNYMFRWYKDSKKCYVYLSDVSTDSKHAGPEPGVVSWESAFRACKWFTRGWTLQELIAPSSVTFFSKEGQTLGDRNSLESLIQDITGIPAEALQGIRPLQQFSIQDRFSWMENRKTKLPEDEAYALQGLFNVFTPWMYGCGRTQAVQTLKRLIDDDLIAKLSITDADNHLRDHHYSDGRLQIERLSGRRLPMENCYINLAIIKKEELTTSGLRDAKLGPKQQSKPSPFELFHRLKIGTLEKNTKIDLSQLFNSRQDSHGRKKITRRILIRGRPGVGKTTLCKRISFGFKRREFWNSLFDRILWIPLRYLKSLTSIQCTFKEFLYHHYFRHHEYGRVLAKHLEYAIRLDENQGQNGKTLLVLDGLDEVSQAWNPDDEKHEFLIKLLNYPNVIITSRPHAQIPQHVERSIDLELETIGFYPNQVNDYLTMAFQDRDRVIEAQTALDKFPLIQGLVRIPILLDAFCYTWDTSSIYGDHQKAQTMTKFYQALVQELLKKDIVRLELFRDGQQVTETIAASMLPTQLEMAAQEQLIFLEYLSFTGMFQDMIEFEPHVRDMVLRTYKQHETNLLIDQSLRRISFLRTSDSQQIGDNVSYHFLHLTFQEFFAAKYFVRQWTSMGQILCVDLRNSTSQSIRIVDFLEKYKYEPRYDIFWRFVAGLLNGDDPNKLSEVNRFFQMLQDPMSRDLLGPAHQRLIMHCLGEVSPHMSLRPELEMALEQWLIFEIELTDHSSLAVEMEFPDQILCKVLDNREHSRDIALLEALEERAILPDTILPHIIARLDGSDPHVKKVAVNVLGSRASDPRVMQALLNQLGQFDDSSHPFRKAVVKALSSQVSDLKVQQALLAQLDDYSPSFREAVVKALSSQVADLKVQQSLLAKLNDDSPSFREALVKALGSQVSDSEIKQALLSKLDDDFYSVREAAAEALSNRASDLEVKQALVARLNHPSHSFREAAVTALSGQLSDPGVKQALLAQLNNQSYPIREDAVKALSSQASDPQIKQGILAKLDDNFYSVREAAVKALSSQLSDLEVKEALLAQLNTYSYSVIEAVVELLDNHASDPRVMQALLAQVDNHSYPITEATIKALSSQPPDVKLKQALLAQLDNNSYSIREAVVNALSSQVSDSQIKQGILAKLDDYFYPVRAAAMRALSSQASDLEVKRALVARLKDPTCLNQVAAAEALSSQASDLEVKEALLTQLNDFSDYVRAAVTKALRSELSDPGVKQAVMALLEDTDTVNNIRWTAANILLYYQTDGFNLFNKKEIKQVYSCLFEQSFQTHFSWQVQSNISRLILPEGSRELCITGVSQFSRAVKEARESHHTPDVSRKKERRFLKGIRWLF